LWVGHHWLSPSCPWQGSGWVQDGWFEEDEKTVEFCPAFPRAEQKGFILSYAPHCVCLGEARESGGSLKGLRGSGLRLGNRGRCQTLDQQLSNQTVWEWGFVERERGKEGERCAGEVDQGSKHVRRYLNLASSLSFASSGASDKRPNFIGPQSLFCEILTGCSLTKVK
jgi:hypothetical protein